MASQKNSEPSMHGEYGFNVKKSVPEWQYPIEDSQIGMFSLPSVSIPPSGTNPLTEATAEDKKKDWRKLLLKWGLLLGGAAGIDKIIDNQDPTKPLEIMGRYTATIDSKTCPACEKANGTVFNILKTHNRPVLPSENLGYTTRHPNCRCKWQILDNYKGKTNKLNKSEEKEIHKIEDHITDAAKKGDLHKVRKDGTLLNRTTKKNPIGETCDCKKLDLKVELPPFRLDLPKDKKTLKESISELRYEFDWLTDDYIAKAKELAEESGGQLYLIRAASETITDHRGEGEEYRRKLSGEELNSMARTAIGKKMDINHQPEFETDAIILDAEYDKNRKEIQMLVVERDPQINDAIEDGKITAVSINGGLPREEQIEPCDHNCNDGNCELCVVPKGVVLGELDGIAMTYVVTDPRGLYWNGHFVPSAEPGVKFTKIERI